MDAPLFLILDDDVAVTRGLARLVTPFGRTRLTHSVAQGLEAANDPTSSFTAAFLDLSLGDGSGFEVLEAIRAVDAGLPVLVLTGQFEPTAINRAVDLGAAYAVKPIDGNRITTFVLRALLRGEDAATRLRGTLDLWRTRYHLTPSEAEILLSVAEGATSDEIVAERDVAASTLRKHSENLRLKTGDDSLQAAAQRLVREALGLRHRGA